MASNNMSGIEKLKELADQIEREHVSELQELKERYKTYLRDARAARDIAIKEAAEYKHQLVDVVGDLAKMDEFAVHLAVDLSVSDDVGCGDELRDAITAVIDEYRKTLVKIGCLLGYDDGDLPMLREFLLGELDKRLMPEGLEWPIFDDGMKITCDDAPEDITAVCLALDGSCYSLHYDMPDDERMCIYEVSERVKRPVTEVLGADGLPIEVAHTQPDTQERINDDATMPPRRYYAEKIGHDVSLKDDEEVFTAVALSLMSRQRELDARTMGGE